MPPFGLGESLLPSLRAQTSKPIFTVPVEGVALHCVQSAPRAPAGPPRHLQSPLFVAQPVQGKPVPVQDLLSCPPPPSLPPRAQSEAQVIYRRSTTDLSQNQSNYHLPSGVLLSIHKNKRNQSVSFRARFSLLEVCTPPLLPAPRTESGLCAACDRQRGTFLRADGTLSYPT